MTADELIEFAKKLKTLDDFDAAKELNNFEAEAFRKGCNVLAEKLKLAVKADLL
jgi:hypothetical protein